ADVLNFVRTRLRGSQLSGDDADAIQETLASLCRNGETQRLIAQMLADASGNARQREFLMNTIESCPVSEFPLVWIESVRQQLRSRDPGVRARAVALIRARQLAGLDDDLQRLVATASEPGNLRVLALGVLVQRLPSLQEESFAFLLPLLRS